MIAPLIDAHLLINLTSTEGLYSGNPALSDDARLIPLVREVTEEIEAAATDDTTTVGLGGMKSKVLAAKKVTAYGIPYVIALGKKKGVLRDILAGKERGTLFLPAGKPMHSRKYWIAFTLKPRGKLFLDEGAKKAILQKGKSLLPSGIVNIEGNFEIGDPVTCADMEGVPFATGLVNYCTADIRKIMGVKTSGIESLLGYKDYDEIIHRDNLAVTKQSGKRK
jgi:glutamate 5-kinase